MSVRKYLFWKNAEGIRTYKVIQKGVFELMKPSGKETYEKELDKFCLWFHKCAGITDDDLIDFCFLSEEKLDYPIFEDYNKALKSSWNSEEIRRFCDENIPANTYEIYYSDDKCFVSQNSNVFDSQNIKKIYLKCIPEYLVEIDERHDDGGDEVSVFNQFFIEELKKLGERKK